MKSIGKLISSIVVSLLAGGTGSIFTVANIPGWYEHLQKSPLNPPNWVFGPVWTTLYILMGIALYLVWVAPGKKRAKQLAYGAFFAQLLLNVLWSVVFFGMHSLWGGAAVIGCLFLAAAITAILFKTFSRPAAWLFAPYIAWICFATYLNVSVAVLN
ncbi:MAG TPA: TspO/MBR family protein [Candidatus Saccharimonadales bacterium]